ncbi:MAG: hypothetical protein ACOCV1_01510 [Bacillota bacterium]
MKIKRNLKNYLFISIIVGALLCSYILINMSYEKEYIITHPEEKEVDYIIDIINCTEWDITENNTFLIPVEYKQSERVFTERKNETHGRYCWYDAFKKEELNETFLNEVCGEENFCDSGCEEEWFCDKGFNVTLG